MEGKLSELSEKLRTLTEKVNHLDDVNAIRDVLNRYGRGLDRHDVELETSAFWEDAQVNYGKFVGGREKFVEWGNALHSNVTARHEHHITNQNIDIDGDIAHVESYVIYILRTRDETSTMLGGARYLDVMERRDGEWRISLREFLPDTMILANSTFKGEFAESWCPPSGEGTWDRNDLSYQRPLRRRDEQETETGSLEIRLTQQ